MAVALVPKEKRTHLWADDLRLAKRYDYTASTGPMLGGVSILVPFNWSILQYATLMLIDWFLGLGGERRGTTWYGKVILSALIALAAGVMLTAADLMCDPDYVSGLWMQVVDSQPLWWDGGAYLSDLVVWKGAGGIPIQNFIGWTETTFVFVSVFIFYLFFQGKDRGTSRLSDLIPLLIYDYLYLCPALSLIVMTWYDPGLQQALLIGTFAMGPVLLLGVLKFCTDATNDPGFHHRVLNRPRQLPAQPEWRGHLRQR